MATQADLDALDKAIASGLLSYEHAGVRVVYRDLKQMLEARAILYAALFPSAAPPARTVGVYNSGLQGSMLYPSRGRCW